MPGFLKFPISPALVKNGSADGDGRLRRAHSATWTKMLMASDFNQNAAKTRPQCGNATNLRFVSLLRA